MITPKKPPKDEREKLVLLGLVDLYLQTGRPVSSNTLKDNDFKGLSSATIRNYFAKLEEDGYLKQQHSSGGRIPTHLAYKLYADTYAGSISLDEKEKASLRTHLLKESREIAGYLQRSAEFLSEYSECAVFLSSPRFDQDFVFDIKLLPIDARRFLCAIITDFGLIHTEVLYVDKKLALPQLKQVEAYFRFRLTGLDKPDLKPELEALASRFYNEITLRHIVRYTNFSAEDIYKTGFSKLLSYPDFNDASALASGLSLFENPTSLRTLLKNAASSPSLSYWIGDDLYSHAPAAHACSVIAIPYKINQTVAGAIAILGPNRIPYRRLFGILQTAADCLSENLTKSVYKFKMTFRQPETELLPSKNTSRIFLLEDKGQYEDPK